MKKSKMKSLRVADARELVVADRNGVRLSEELSG